MLNEIPIKRSLENKDLAAYICRQLNIFFPDNRPLQWKEMNKYVKDAEERVFRCFAGIKKKYFMHEGIVHFNHLQSDQYCMYLCMLANHIYQSGGNTETATKIYYLNKALHSVDIYFNIQLPDIFLFVHPLGTILGRAEFSDYFITYQGCTVGCLNSGVFPRFKGKTILYANSKVLGECEIGDNVCIASGVSVINTNVPDNVIVFGKYPDYTFKENKSDIFSRPPFVYGN